MSEENKKRIAILIRRDIKIRDFFDVFSITEKENLELNGFKQEIIEKIKDMLKFEKYHKNIKNKKLQLDNESILEEEEMVLLTPINKDFPKFVKEFSIFLKEVIEELRL